VEFAVVAVTFFIIVLGIIDIGRGFMVQDLLLNAARRGCRVGILPGNGTTAITNAVTAALQPAGITSDTVSVTVNDGVSDPLNASSGADVTVKVSVPTNTVTWLPFTNYLSANITAQYTLRKQ
jgi:Flp pilus assembly protein TadG